MTARVILLSRLDPRTYTISRQISSPTDLPIVTPLWRPDIHAQRRPRLLARNRIIAAVRDWFEASDFVEVETAALQVSPGNETHLHAFSTEAVSPEGDRLPLHLRTSPEFACKTLLAAGETRLFELARAWRNRERGALHHPEFTLLEWYRAGEPYEALMDDCAGLLALAADVGGARQFCFRGRRVDPRLEPDRLTVAEAFNRFAGIDLLATTDSDGGVDREHLGAQAKTAGVRTAEDDSWSDIFSRVLLDKIEPNIGEGRATILCEYPLAEAALARPKPGAPKVAERFELYACGVELANAFGELTDPVVQRARFEADMAQKARLYGETYPIDEAFLDALGHMPQASGAALGLDRLVMLATGAEHIEQVLWAPVARPEP
jgi:lysyl-tRNA synthetase class 2